MNPSTIEPLPTRCAHWGYDDHRFFGHAVFAELAGNETATGLAALAVTQRRVSPEARGVLDDIAVCLTLADPRIWPLKLTRLVASYGAAVPAMVAGLATIERAKVGPWPCAQAARLLVTVTAELGDAREDPAALRAWVQAYVAKHRVVTGFGTPFRDHDERLVALRACLERRGRDTLPYWRTAEALAVAVREVCHAEPNIGVGLGAACLDLGLSPDDVGPLSTAMAVHMFLGNAVEGARQQPASLRRLPDACANYVGRAARTSPRAAGDAPPVSTPASRT